MVSLPDPQHTAVQLSKKLKSLLIHANTAWSQGWTGTKETTDNHRWQHLTESVLDSTGLFCLHFCTLTTRTMTPANCCDTRLWNNLLHHYFLGLCSQGNHNNADIISIRHGRSGCLTQICLTDGTDSRLGLKPDGIPTLGTWLCLEILHWFTKWSLELGRSKAYGVVIAHQYYYSSTQHPDCIKFKLGYVSIFTEPYGQVRLEVL